MIPIVILGALVLLVLAMGKGAAKGSPAQVAQTVRDMQSGVATLEQVREAAAAAKNAGLSETAAVMDRTADIMQQRGGIRPSPPPDVQQIAKAVSDLRKGQATEGQIAAASNAAESRGLPETAKALNDALAQSTVAKKPPTSKPVLRRGSKGAAVGEAQSLLKSAGFDPGKIDGKFGPKTETATRAFQAARKLVVDGVIGSLTCKALYASAMVKAAAPPTPSAASLAPSAAAPRAAPPPAARPTLRRGSKGAAVRTAQTLLTGAGFSPGKADGDFGPKTEAATKAFQSARQLKADGVIGPQTWTALYAASPPGAAAAGQASPIPGVSGAAWGRYVRAMISQGPGVAAPNGALGMFRYHPRRVQQAGHSAEAWLASS